MTDPLQTILQQVGLKKAAFPTTSRYFGIDTAIFETEKKDPIVYLRRRFVPPADRFHLLQEHTVTEGERLDNLTNQYLGDPEQFWRVCDSNNAVKPDELTEITGRKIRITLPEGVPGTSNA